MIKFLGALNKIIFSLVASLKCKNLMKNILKLILLHAFQLQVIPKRCDVNLTQCENMETIAIRDICKILDMGDQLWTNFMANTQPKAKCPFNMKVIKVTNATVDLGYIANLPLDGFTWVLHFKSFPSAGKPKYKKHLLYCGSAEIVITKSRTKNKFA